jgi:hypothetical protein
MVLTLRLPTLALSFPKFVKRTPSKHVNPSSVPHHKYPSRVWRARAMKLPGKPSYDCQTFNTYCDNNFAGA